MLNSPGSLSFWVTYRLRLVCKEESSKLHKLCYFILSNWHIHVFFLVQSADYYLVQTSMIVFLCHWIYTTLGKIVKKSTHHLSTHTNIYALKSDFHQTSSKHQLNSLLKVKRQFNTWTMTDSCCFLNAPQLFECLHKSKIHV